MSLMLSIIIPYYNEIRTLRTVVTSLLSTRLTMEIFLVDDGSSDGSSQSIEDLLSAYVHLIRKEKNEGKGAAIRIALPKVRGDVVIIQDADLEYSPLDLETLIKPFEEDPNVAAVYGMRCASSKSYWRYHLGGRFVTWVANQLYETRLHDIPTGYKLIRRSVFQRLFLSEDGFGFCYEVTARLAQGDYLVMEVPIHYQPRTFAEGKKIGPWDGLRALWVLVRLKF